MKLKINHKRHECPYSIYKFALLILEYILININYDNNTNDNNTNDYIKITYYDNNDILNQIERFNSLDTQYIIIYVSNILQDNKANGKIYITLENEKFSNLLYSYIKEYNNIEVYDHVNQLRTAS